jgi:hypothetical protein
MSINFYEDVQNEIRQTGSFTVTDQHLALLRRAYVSWVDAETGAPCIDPERPYGNSAVDSDVAEIADPIYRSLDDCDDRFAYTEDGPTYARLMRLHAETATALQIALCTGEFRTGQYRTARPYRARSWRRVAEKGDLSDGQHRLEGLMGDVADE